MSTKKMPREIALTEMHNFLKKWSDDNFDNDKIEKLYPSAISAYEDGRLGFSDDMVPTLALAEPITSEEGNVVVSEINFRTRIKPSDQARLADGLKIETQMLRYSLNMLSYLINQPINYIDKMSKSDYNAVQQLASVFS